MIARAQAKVDAIKQAKQKVGELRPIDEVVFAQNVPKYNLEWEYSPNGRATSYLATLVCRYMHKLQQKDKKVVLSAKALETIYHTASSSIGKLISGKQYLGGYALEQVRDKVEAEGKELPFSCLLVTTINSHHSKRKYRTCKGVVGVKYRDCTGIGTGNDES